MKHCVLGLVLLLAGCVEDPKECVQDDDCPGGSVCVGLRCMPEADEGTQTPPDATGTDMRSDPGDQGTDMGPDVSPDMQRDDMGPDVVPDMQPDAMGPDGAPPAVESCNGRDDDGDGTADEGLDCSLRLEGRLVWVAGGGETDEYRLEGRGRILGGATMSNDEWTLTGDLVVGGR